MKFGLEEDQRMFRLAENYRWSEPLLHGGPVEIEATIGTEATVYNLVRMRHLVPAH